MNKYIEALRNGDKILNHGERWYLASTRETVPCHQILVLESSGVAVAEIREEPNGKLSAELKLQA